MKSIKSLMSLSHVQAMDKFKSANTSFQDQKLLNKKISLTELKWLSTNILYNLYLNTSGGNVVSSKVNLSDILTPITL